MGTSFEELYDVFMSVSIVDFRLNNLFINNREVFYSYLDAFLKKSVWECSESLIHSLDYEYIEENIGTNDNQILVNRGYFKDNLYNLEKLIIVDFLTIFWYQKNIDDIVVTDERIATKSERNINTDAPLKVKMQRVSDLKCEVQAKIKDLQSDHLEEYDWGDW